MDLAIAEWMMAGSSEANRKSLVKGYKLSVIR